MLKKTLKPIWDLNCFYPKSSYGLICKQLKSKIEKLNITSKNLVSSILALQNLESAMQNAMSYAGCLYAQNTSDPDAIHLNETLQTLNATLITASNTLDTLLAKLTDKEFKDLLSSKELNDIHFPLKERRKLSKEKLPLEQEILIQDLMVDGLHGWYQLYQTHVGKMRITVSLNGKKKVLSVGQLHNQLTHPNRKTRSHLFLEWKNAWNNEKDIFSQILNRISGFRLKVYEKRGWHSPLKEALTIHRMDEKTLNTMWKVIENNKKPFADYLAAKAKLLKLKKLSWHDVSSPIGRFDKEIPYDEGFALIETWFQKFSPSMGHMMVRAKKEKWVEAEDRPGKAPGGFCTPFPLAKQSRIFMTYSNTIENLMTLAHELGHAYHSDTVFDLPPFAQNYPMSLAETASTFAEQILSDALLSKFSNPSEKLFLLDQRLQRSVIFLMNIHSRFLFENTLYKHRAQETLSAEQLCELMEKAQKEAYCDMLQDYNPYFWAEKLHFYLTAIPFYNFPYTFGYLFSMGIYALKPTPEVYCNLLHDTGKMNCEDLAKKHLNVDLRKPDFWQKALNIAIEDAHEFVKEVKKTVHS